MTARSIIAGTGFFVPPRVVNNEELSILVDTSDEWIQARTGIKTRHLVDPKDPMTTVDMAERAARMALEHAQTKPEELDIIVFATVSSDLRLPSCACLLQVRLGAHRAFAFDIAAACAGSLHALAIADRFMDGEKYGKALVIGAELMSSILDWTDRNTCVLFGDAASVAVLVPSDGSPKGFIDFDLCADGTQSENIWMCHGGKVHMKGGETFKFAVRALSGAVMNLLRKHRIAPNDIAYVVAHQANLRILEAVSERIGIGMERFSVNIDRYANTSSASLLLTYHEAWAKGLLKPGDLVLMMAIGAGITWGVGLYRV